MTRETKIGLAMVLVLISVFGFLVYKRATRPGDTLVQSESVDEGEVGVDEDDPAKAEEPVADDEDEPMKVIPVAAEARSIPQDEPDDAEVDDPFGESPSKPAKAHGPQPKLLVAIPDEEPEAASEAENELDSFAIGETSTSTRETTAVASPAEPEADATDPFAQEADEAAEEPVRESPAVAEKSAPVLEFESIEVNSEETFGAADEEPVRHVPVQQLPVKSPPVNSFTGDEQESDEETSVSARASIPDRAIDFGEDETEDAAAMEPVAEVMEPVEDMTEPFADMHPQPQQVEPSLAAQPVPELMLDDAAEGDRYGDYEPIELADADDAIPWENSNVRSDAPKNTGASVSRRTIAGNRHVVQAGENFWSISQKKYGTGRYFQALSAHNLSVVPDPAKMKPGVEISLPAEDELERRYPALVSPTGATEPGAATGSALQVRGEYLIGSGGQPMYRIGSGDTLSEIAQRYLGRARRWEQILVMNRDVLKDGNTLKVGAILRLPNDATQLQLSNQPREFR